MRTKKVRDVVQDSRFLISEQLFIVVAPVGDDFFFHKQKILPKAIISHCMFNAIFAFVVNAAKIHLIFYDSRRTVHFDADFFGKVFIIKILNVV